MTPEVNKKSISDLIGADEGQNKHPCQIESKNVNVDTSCYSVVQEWDAEGNLDVMTKNVKIGFYSEQYKKSKASLKGTNTYQSENSRLFKNEQSIVTQRSRQGFEKYKNKHITDEEEIGLRAGANEALSDSLSDFQSRIYPDKSINIDPTHNSHTRDVYLGEKRIASYTIDSRKPGEPIIRYFHANHVGTVEFEINQTNQAVRYATYDPYGLPVLDSYRTATEDEYKLPRYGFVGKELDVSGNYYFGARYFDPKTALWLSGDPGIISSVKFITKTKNLPIYSNAIHNPYRYVDKTGREADVATVWAFALAEPTPFGEIVATVYTIGKYSLVAAGISLSMKADNSLQPNDKNKPKKATDSSKNEKHGDSGRSAKKFEKQISDLKNKLKTATGKNKKKIKQTIQNINKNAQKNKKGTEDTRIGKRK